MEDNALFSALESIVEDKPSNTNEISPDVLIEQSENFKTTKPELEDKKEDNLENDVEKETEEKKEEGKTWKLDENGKKISTMVPKERFDEKNRLAKDLEAKVKDYEAKLSKYEEENTKLTLDLSHIKPENYKDWDEYIAARDAESFKIQRNIIKQEMEQEKLMSKVKEAEQNLINSFDNNLQETKKEIPEIDNVVTEFAKYKQYIAPETMYTLMSDDNASKVIYEIMTTDDALKTLAGMSPVQAAGYIARISTRIDMQKNVQPISENFIERVIPSTPIHSKPKVAGSPNLKGSSDKSVVREESTSNKISKKESEEFAKLFSNR